MRAALDQQFDDLNGRAHAAGARQRMRSTECVARGIDGFNASTKSILEEVRLPGFGLGSGEVKAVWPRPTVPWNIAYAQSMAAMMTPPPLSPEMLAEVEREGGFENGGYVKVMQRRQREESDRVAEFYRKQEEGREAMAAAERQRQRDAYEERRRNGG
jgi:hypothetical protein